jgi:heme exporter protein C
MSAEEKGSWVLGVAAALLIALAGYAALFVAPEERTMRAIQRIFYFHVGCAWTALSAFLTVFVSNIVYLARRNMKWDWLGVASAEVGVAFCSAVLVTGPIWARPVWGIWWTWDARLTSTFVLWLMYVTFLLLRALLPDAERRARICAVFGVFAFLDVPLVYFSIWLWRTQHPQPVIGGGGSLDPTMRWVLFLCWGALLSLMILLVRLRYRLEQLRHEAQEILLRVEASAPGETFPSSPQSREQTR